MIFVEFDSIFLVSVFCFDIEGFMYLVLIDIRI